MTIRPLIANTLDDYFYIPFISEKLGYTRCRILETGVLEEIRPSLSVKAIFSTAAKILSYMTIIIPVIVQQLRKTNSQSDLGRVNKSNHTVQKLRESFNLRCRRDPPFEPLTQQALMAYADSYLAEKVKQLTLHELEDLSDLFFQAGKLLREALRTSNSKKFENDYFVIEQENDCLIIHTKLRSIHPQSPLESPYIEFTRDTSIGSVQRRVPLAEDNLMDLLVPHLIKQEPLILGGVVPRKDGLYFNTRYLYLEGVQNRPAQDMPPLSFNFEKEKGLRLIQSPFDPLYNTLFKSAVS